MTLRYADGKALASAWPSSLTTTRRLSAPGMVVSIARLSAAPMRLPRSGFRDGSAQPMFSISLK